MHSGEILLFSQKVTSIWGKHEYHVEWCIHQSCRWEGIELLLLYIYLPLSCKKMRHSIFTCKTKSTKYMRRVCGQKGIHDDDDDENSMRWVLNTKQQEFTNKARVDVCVSVWCGFVVEYKAMNLKVFLLFCWVLEYKGSFFLN